MSSEKSETLTRGLTGVAIVGVTLAAILGGPWSWWSLLLVLSFLGWKEARAAIQAAWPGQSSVLCAFWSLLVVGIPFCALAALGWRNGVYSSMLPLGWFVLLWVNDTGAYLVGRQWGRRRIAPSISPGKSWEGWAGGTVMTLLVGYAVLGAADGWGGLSAQAWLGLGALVSVFGPAGDLLESALKRKAGIKDSGSVLPGHGGILDRFDSHAVAAPLAVLLLQIF